MISVNSTGKMIFFTRSQKIASTYKISSSGDLMRDKEKSGIPETIILADRFEMLIAVIYLEDEIDAVKKFLKKHKFFQEIDKFKKKILR